MNYLASWISWISSIPWTSWISGIFGLLGGGAISYGFWWLKHHYYVPKIQFPYEVSRSKADFIKSGIRYQIALKNNGRRDAFNVRYRVKIMIKDILQNGGTIWDLLDVPVSNNEYFVLRTEEMFRVTPIFEKTKLFSKLMFSKSIVEKYEKGVLTLDDFFDEYKDVRIYLEVIGTDRFSGGSKYFRSKEFTKQDVRWGVYKGNDPLVIHKQLKASARIDG